ncbi:fucolectin-1-like [Lineus longissimus]|uniref:fucolectin-1-like n=1 Tax=Lineus longissimus TaxID=88925 RepID=UPI00315CF1D9
MGKKETNVALRKPAFQFDVSSGGVPQRAVDGNADTNYGRRSCTHTHNRGRTSRNWWAVDLQARYTVKRVEVVNRGDCCWQRLKNFQVLVTDVKPQTGKDLKGVRVCVHHKGGVGKGATQRLTCKGGVSGRYVAVQQARSQPLTLCEVRVFGTKASRTSPNKCFTHRHGDCWGNDIKHYGGKTLDQCKSLCKARADCRSIQHRGKSCWLKWYACESNELRSKGNKTFHQWTNTCGKLETAYL